MISTSRKLRVAVPILFALSGCGGTDGDTAASLAEEAVPVVVTPARVEDVSREITAVASLDSELDAELRAELGGRVGRQIVAEGERVSAGTSLLRIDTRVHEIQVEKARAAVVQAEAQFYTDSLRAVRTRALLEEGAVDPQTVDDLEARLAQSRGQLASARAALEMAEHDYARSTVPAPFGGVFLDRRVDPGDYVQAGDPLGRLVDLDSLRLTFRVPEVHATSLRPGDEVPFTVNAIREGGREFKATIYYVGPAVSAETRTFEVKARTANSEGVLQPGMSAEARIAVSREPDAVVVPEVAVRRLEGGASRLFIVSGERVRSVSVEAGVRPAPGRIVVRGEIQGGDSVVVAGFQRLDDGTRVTVTAGDRSGEGEARAPERHRSDVP